MHRVTSSNNTSDSGRPPQKEKRLSYVLNDGDDKKHCAGVNCVVVSKPSTSDGLDYVFTGSRDGTLKRWAVTDDEASCSATFESHIDWVNDAVLAGDVLVSCSSDTTIKTWNSLSNGVCTGTLHQHSDYVMCLATSRQRSNIVASAALGGEVFIWDLNAAHSPIASPIDTAEEMMPSLCGCKASDDILIHNTQPHGHNPITVEGHKKSSIYSLAMSDNGNVLVSGGTEKVIRVWDARTGSKNMKLKGHSDNIRALLLDSTGRFCLSGSSDKLICLWDLGQQRCVHSYVVHKDSVFALASTPEFTHVYSGGRDQSLYLTDLSTRESILLYKKEDPILRMALCDDSIWVATTDSSVDRLPAEGNNLQRMLKNGASFIARSLSFTRSRTSEGPAPVTLYKSPSLTIPGKPRILQYEILNSRRHILTKDTSGSVKLWEITNGLVIEDYGKVSFEKKKKELFEKASIPAWFTVDNRLGCLSIHLDSPQCFSAEMNATELNSEAAQDDAKINLAEETLSGLLAHWKAKRMKRMESQASSNTDIEQENNTLMVHPSFEFSSNSPPSIVTQGSQGGSWRRRNTNLDGTEDEKDLPWWCIDCILNGNQSQREVTK
ncbi:WD repeat-containing protein 48-like [Zingiber officinale]|uniref:WD repeat-containing protein 48-like n=1 Tax=Zingiber officinale TaxID=94328 RepID=UPI001C4A8A87|nr:WD repeat-containing protein 48-like [Zingiber officinale]